MGLFGGKKKTYVASAVYNLAGDVESRADILKLIAVRTLLSGVGSMGENLRNSLLNGTALTRRNFFRWVKGTYPEAVPVASIGGNRSVEAADVLPRLIEVLGLPANQTPVLLRAAVDGVDPSYWAEAWLLENHPTLVDADWSVDFNQHANVLNIAVADPETEVQISFSLPAPAEYLSVAGTNGARLLYASYFVLETNETTGAVDVLPPVLFTYLIGSGDAVFDALDSPDGTGLQEFFPAIKLRQENVWVTSEEDLTEANTAQGITEEEFSRISKMYRKCMGERVGKVIEKLQDNENINDINNIYVAFGVSLNSKETIAQRYLWDFFTLLMESQDHDLDSYEAYVESLLSTAEGNAYFDRWVTGNLVDASITHPLYGSARPEAGVAVASAPLNVLRVASPEVNMFDFRMSWSWIKKTTHVGNAARYDGAVRDTLAPGEYFFHAPTQDRDLPFFASLSVSILQSMGVQKSLPKLYMLKQTGPFTYDRLEVTNLLHSNYVYNGKAVEIDAFDALADEEESGFLVPLHYPTLRNMGLLDEEKLVRVSSYLVMNSYKVVKIKWYQRGLFRIILSVAFVVIGSITFGAGLAAGAGVLGSNVAVGVAIGASVASAALIGAIANAVAAVVLTTLIQTASTAIFGDKLGAVIGTIATFVAIKSFQSYSATGSFSVDWSTVFNADNLLNLTTTMSSAYSAWLNADTKEIYTEMGVAKDDYEEAMDSIKDKADEILGMTDGTIDPILLTNALEQTSESRTSYLTRTLLTGSDIADLTYAMISDFSDLTLDLPRPD